MMQMDQDDQTMHARSYRISAPQEVQMQNMNASKAPPPAVTMANLKEQGRFQHVLERSKARQDAKERSTALLEVRGKRKI
jgi:hypothetical protein